MDTNIQRYLAFVKSAECGSLTKAAEKLGYSHSGISRMISKLEKEWHVALFEREQHGIKLTDDGMRLLPHAKNICMEYERLHMKLNELSAIQSGIVRIGAFPDVSSHWLPGIIKEFQKTYPNINYEMLIGDYTEIEGWIFDGRVDCGFLRLPTHPDLDTILLKQDKLLVVLPENHPFAPLDKFPAAALCDEPFILWEKDTKAEVSEILEQLNLAPKIRMTTWDGCAILSMVEIGLGISILPELALTHTRHRVLTKELDTPAYREIGIALRNKKAASLTVKHFLEYLQYQ